MIVLSGVEKDIMRFLKLFVVTLLIFAIFPAYATTKHKTVYKKHHRRHVSVHKTVKKPVIKKTKPVAKKNLIKKDSDVINDNSVQIIEDKPQFNPELTKNLDIYNLFTFDELKILSDNDKPEGDLGKKLDYALNNAVVNNNYSYNNDYQFKTDSKIGEYIRAASWNISRGFHLSEIKQIFTDSEQIFSTIKNPDKNTLKSAVEEQQILKDSDIIILNEVDVGMFRTGYANVIDDLASTLKYNYAYGIEFLEVDPVHLGMEDYKWSEERFLFPKAEKILIDEKKYKGLHGTAILSKFPLENVRIIRLPKSYDWFKAERKRISELESLKRNAANAIFKEEMIREIRIGSRIALVADVKIPGVETPVTVVAVHLENRTIPANRKKQVEYLLSHISNIKNPVILGGDLNTMCNDGSPTGITKEIKKRLKDPNFLARTAISAVVPAGYVVSAVANVSQVVRTYTDPTVKNIPIISPNKERGTFSPLKRTKFEDGYYFDFRGMKEKSSNKSGRLSNSNERNIIGFTPTFIFERPILIGKYKLDWFFVKGYLHKQKFKKGPYKFAPHYGRTLFDLNYIFPQPLSDHVPITVDVPINEPVNTKSKK